MSLLTLEGVSKAFAGVQAVRSVSFGVARGAVLGVMGPNGSGKTTLFNLIAGALRPDAGRIRFEEHDVTRLPPHRMCERGVARTFQHARTFPGLTALDNVLVGQRYGRRRAAGGAAAEARRLLTLAGVPAEKTDVPAGRLSLLERRRVELARALATGPSLLLLDEFMAGLTHAETEAAMGLVRRLHGEGLTLILVEHIVWALLDLCDRLVVLSAGEKIAEGAPAAVAADPAVVDAYLGTASG